MGEFDGWLDLRPDPVHVKREREKARALRASGWWKAELQRGVCHHCGQKALHGAEYGYGECWAPEVPESGYAEHEVLWKAGLRE